ncbi:MAG: hypothetical protein SGILL_005286 [Bacillariaceae sp.]
MLFRTTALALLVASAAAFSTSKPASVRPAVMPTSTARAILLSDQETQAVMDSAQDCIESECSIDETTELLTTLKSTEKDLEARLNKVMNMISHLQHINAKEERQTDEVRAFVKDMLRVFSTEVSVRYFCWS